jgi:hypothetical protein
VSPEEVTEVENLGALLMDEVESKKENCPDRSPRSEVNSVANETAARRTSQSYSTTSSGAKRQKIVSPTSVKFIDAGDEPLSPPTSRKISRGTMPDSNGEGEKKVLSEIENIR